MSGRASKKAEVEAAATAAVAQAEEIETTEEIPAPEANAEVAETETVVAE